MKKIGIYVHIPFCRQKCKYCDFISFANKEELKSKYFETLLKEIEECTEKDFEVNTIYFGGGTPSSVSSKYIIDIINKIKEKFLISKDAEVTIEVNPGTVDKQKLIDYKTNGFNRISIGLQAVQDRLLNELGRIHSYKDFVDCYTLVQNVGFKNINVDLMLGLPNQSLKDLQESIIKLIRLEPKHISLYSLIVEDGTPLEREIKDGTFKLPNDDYEREMYDSAKKLLEKNGYIHYEISNFAKKGFESKHNLNCWNQEEYLGFGLASHSYFNKKRFSNTIDFEKYIKNRKENVVINEIQTDEMQKKEYMMLGFRKLNGVSISEFERKFEINPLFYFRFEISKLVEDDLIEVDLDNIRLTRKGLDLANIVFEQFV